MLGSKTYDNVLGAIGCILPNGGAIPGPSDSWAFCCWLHCMHSACAYTTPAAAAAAEAALHCTTMAACQCHWFDRRAWPLESRVRPGLPIEYGL